MPQTGNTAETSGIYSGDCGCRREIALSQGEKFPPCPSCKEAVNWTLKEATQESNPRVAEAANPGLEGATALRFKSRARALRRLFLGGLVLPFRSRHSLQFFLAHRLIHTFGSALETRFTSLASLGRQRGAGGHLLFL